MTHVTQERLREQGLMGKGLPPQPRTGTMSRLISQLSPGAAKWVYEQTEFGTIPMSDVVADLVEDAYLENLEKERERYGMATD